MLNEAQQRNLHIVMRLIEEKMRALEFRLVRPEEHGVMFEISNDMSADIASALRQEIQEAMTILRELKHCFSLPRETTPTSQELVRGLSQLWVSLQESDSKGLRRFGNVHSAVSPALDSQVERLAELMLKMGGLIREHRRPVFVEAHKEQSDSQH